MDLESTPAPLDDEPESNPHPPQADLATLAHFARYERFARACNITVLALYIAHFIASKETILAAYQADPNLNNISIHKWDSLHSQMRVLIRECIAVGALTEEECPGWSLANTVCMLKHVARYYIAEIPVPEGARRAENQAS